MYEYIEEYQMVSNSRKNMYTQPRSLGRPDSPYQDMKSVGVASSTSATHLEAILQGMPSPGTNYIAVGPKEKPTATNNGMHVTPGGSVVYQSRTSDGSIGEGDYTVMNSAGTPAQLELTRFSITVPENALPYEGQPNGEYKFTEC